MLRLSLVPPFFTINRKKRKEKKKDRLLQNVHIKRLSSSRRGAFSSMHGVPHGEGLNGSFAESHVLTREFYPHHLKKKYSRTFSAGLPPKLMGAYPHAVNVMSSFSLSSVNYS